MKRKPRSFAFFLSAYTITTCILASRGFPAQQPPIDDPPQERLMLRVESVKPTQHKLGAFWDTNITIEFSRAVNPETIVPGTFWAAGRWSGPAEGEYSFSPDMRTVTLDPVDDFSAGEIVTVMVSNRVRAADGTPMRDAGFSSSFTARTRESNMTFREIAVLNTQGDDGQHSKAYGGVAADLDNDKFLDLSIVNELSSDVRVFMNHGTWPGTFSGFIEPTCPVGNKASPSEPGDFNADGIADLAVGNVTSNSVSILIGNGDGTFAPQTEIPVGPRPRGVCVLDVDGDGDVDVVNTNSLSSEISILLNDGQGVFAPAYFIDTGFEGAWGLWATDMDNDGIQDLVLGANVDQLVAVFAGAGDGTYQFVSSKPSGGAVWQITCGDINGDGNQDVTVANGLSNNAATLMGDGAGNLGDPTIYPSDAWSTASDLGDMDGDGDLDWIYGAFFGDWTFQRNNGDGTFTFLQMIPAPSAASCCIMFDMDNDGDLDLGLVDEEVDVVLLWENMQLGNPSCGDLASIIANCAPGSMTLTLVLNNNCNGCLSGTQVFFALNGTRYIPATVTGNKATLTIPSPVTPITVSIGRPSGCHLTIPIASCP